MRLLPSGGLRIENFLLGKSTAEGVFQDFTGRVRRRFSVELEGAMDGSTLVLHEAFVFDDGATENRVWRISPQGERYTATADDMVGEARGAVRDGVLAWSYVFNLKLGARRLRVRFRETFLQTADDVVLNSARVSKFGFEIGRTTIIFRK
jgi:predicted HAD superfamily phosphohydrolase